MRLAMNDAELLARVSSGDTSAFDVLYDRHATDVLRYAWAVSPTRDAVEDLVQDTFVTCWERARAISIVELSALPWLLTTCRNHALNRGRKEERWKGVTDVHQMLIPDGSAAELAAREELRWVLAAIDRLPTIDRQLCELCFIQGLSYDEAAAALQTTPAAVGKRLQRSRSRLRKERLS